MKLRVQITISNEYGTNTVAHWVSEQPIEDLIDPVVIHEAALQAESEIINQLRVGFGKKEA
jgi:hypothetical protein